MAAVGVVLNAQRQRPKSWLSLAVEQHYPPPDFERWWRHLASCTPALIPGMLQGAFERCQFEHRENSLRREVENLAAALNYTYEEVHLLHTLTSNLHLSRAPQELAQLVLERVQELIPAAGHALWIDDGHGQLEFQSRGHFPLSELEMAQFLARFDHHDWPRPLVRNHLSASLLGSDFPGLNNIVIVPIGEGEHRVGWMSSANRHGSLEFGTTEARLMSTVASILGTHSRNIELYNQHDELLLSFVRSLVSSLDAKDTYTRGHSERVALIARRLGADLQLPEQDLQDIHLSGLLHDIGKIGIDDNILRKPDDLTSEEYEEIKKHPVIGYNILCGLKNLQPILPGVRHHHENYNGRGYPDGLSGEQIPLMARILAVADSYDAMGSDRPYRAGRPLSEIEEIFRKGSGQQWDPRVIEAYFRVRGDIQRICRQYVPQSRPWANESESASSDVVFRVRR